MCCSRQLLMPSVCLLLALGSQVSCSTQPGVLQPPIETGIVPGVYSGVRSYEFKQWVTGQLINTVNREEPYTEVVDPNGLPLIQPDGDQPVVGLRSETTDATGRSVLEVTAVTWSGNTLLINFKIDLMRADGLNLSGSGWWQYDKLDDNTINYTSSVTLGGINLAGLPTTGKSTESATLTR